MALKLIVDTLDGIAEPQQSLYVKQGDGKYKLDVDGIEDTKGLKSALATEREQRAAAEAKLKGYDGIDLEEVRRMANMVENSEDAKLLKEAIGDKTKMDALRQRWVDNVVKAKDKEIDKLKSESKAEIEKANKKATARDARVLDNELRAASEKVGIYGPAIGDVLVTGRGTWSLDDDGNAVMLDKNGEPVMGQKGPLTPSEWLESLREEKPHWFPASGNGGGASQSKTVPKGKAMKRAAFEQLDAVSRRQTVKDGIQIVD